MPQFPHLKIGRSDEVMATKGSGQLGRVAHTAIIIVWEQLDSLKRGRGSGEEKGGKLCLNWLQKAGRGAPCLPFKTAPPSVGIHSFIPQTFADPYHVPGTEMAA